MNRLLHFTFSAFEEALLFNLGGLGVAVVALFLLQIPIKVSFGFVILIESTGLMLVGGALGVAGQATSQKIAELLTRNRVKQESVAASDYKAALYAFTGIVLFAEAALMAFLFA